MGDSSDPRLGRSYIALRLGHLVRCAEPSVISFSVAIVTIVALIVLLVAVVAAIFKGRSRIGGDVFPGQANDGFTSPVRLWVALDGASALIVELRLMPP